MGFTDKLREALGAEGVQIAAQIPDQQTTAGGMLHAKISATGGTKQARLDAYIVRLIQSNRRWADRSGNPVSEQDALREIDRSHLVATWDRRAVAEMRVETNHDLQPEQVHDTSFEMAVPTDCPPTTLACTYVINVQADVKGQIDPSANARVRIG